MRQNRWMPRKLATPDGPRTIQQVREDAARDGCIYLPQQDSSSNKPPAPPINQLQEVIFSKIRPKGMDDIFGGPADLGMNLGMDPGVIKGNDNNSFNNGFHHNNGFDNGGYLNSGPSFEEKFRENNSNFNNSDQRDYKDNYKKRDSFESKSAERPDFGNRFTANRNKTHPSNRGGRGEREGERRGYPQYESRPQNGGNQNQNGKDVPPRLLLELVEKLPAQVECGNCTEEPCMVGQSVPHVSMRRGLRMRMVAYYPKAHANMSCHGKNTRVKVKGVANNGQVKVRDYGEKKLTYTYNSCWELNGAMKMTFAFDC